MPVPIQTLPTTENKALFLASVLNYIKDAVWFLDADLRILDINTAACQLLGWQREQVIGLSYYDVLPTVSNFDHKNLSQYVNQCIVSAEKVSFLHGLTLSPGNGRVTIVEGVIYPLMGSGHITGVAIVFRSISSHTEIERLQADFISMASHSLRSPLMSIQSSMDYILEGQAGEIKRKRLLENVRVQSRKMAVLLRELLDTSQIASGKEILVRTQLLGVTPLIETVAQEFRLQYPKILLQLNVPATLPTITTDKVKVELVLRNLLNHARLRNKSRGRIRLTVNSRNKDIEFSVSDEGPSLDIEQRGQIFWHIYALEPEKGAGDAPYEYVIGLFITRRLVELLGGSIWITQPHTKGIDVNFTLPIRRHTR